MSVRSAHAREEQLLDVYWREIKDNPPLTRTEEIDLFTRLRAGDEAVHQRIVESNLRFVVKIANEYARTDGPSVLELVAEGNVGLLTAIRRFDESLGFKFITYAVWWIRRSILRAMADHRHSLRLPLSRMEDHHKLEKQADHLAQLLGRAASFDEVVESAGVSPARALNASHASYRALSLDAPVNGDSAVSLHALLPAPTPDEDSSDEELILNTMTECLTQLRQRDAEVLRAYYGLGSEEPRTLEQIGAQMGITRERVRQLRNRALSCLREECGQQLQSLMSN